MSVRDLFFFYAEGKLAAEYEPSLRPLHSVTKQLHTTTNTPHKTILILVFILSYDYPPDSPDSLDSGMAINSHVSVQVP